MIRVEKTYGVVPQRLNKLCRQIACKQAQTKRWKRNKSQNRRKKGNFKYGVLVPDSPEKAKEIDRANGNNLWGGAMFVEAQSQIDHTTYLFLGPEEEIPEGYQKVKLRTIFNIKQDLHRKIRTIAGGHEVDAFDINCHSSNMD